MSRGKAAPDFGALKGTATATIRPLGGEPLGMSVIEAAAAAGVSKQTLYTEINEGRLPARKLAGRTIILREDFIAFLNALPLAAKRSA